MGRGQRDPSITALGPYSTQQPKSTHYLVHSMLEPQHTAEEQQVGQEARASTLTHNSVPLQGRTRSQLCLSLEGRGVDMTPYSFPPGW